MSILAGPVCTDGYTWWQIKSESLEGWTAEGDGSDYWLVPVRGKLSVEAIDQLTEVSRWTWDRDEASDVSFSKDGQLLAIALNRGISLIDTQLLRESRFIETAQPVTRVSVSPDGAWLAAIINPTFLTLWRRSDYSLQYSFDTGTAPIEALIFSPDGQWLAAAADKQVFIWRTADGVRQRSLDHPEPVTEIVISADGQSLAALSDWGQVPSRSRVHVWNVADGSLARLFEFDDARFISSIGFSPDDQHLQMTANGRTIEFWHRMTGNLERSVAIPSNITEAYQSMRNTVLEDGTAVSVPTYCREGCAIEAIRWQLDTGVILNHYGDTADPQAKPIVSPDRRFVVIRDPLEGVFLFALGGDRILFRRRPDYPVNQLTFQGHQRQVVLERPACWGCFLYQTDLWDLDSGTRVSELSLKYTAHTFSPNGSLLAQMDDCHASPGTRVMLLDPDRLAPPHDIQRTIWTSNNLPCWGTTVTFSPDTEWLAVGFTARADQGNSAVVRLWRVVDGSSGATLNGHTDGVSAVAFSPDSSLIATAAKDKTIKLWRVADSVLVTTITTGDLIPIKVTFSPDGTWLAATFASNIDVNLTEMTPIVQVWRVTDGTLAKVLEHEQAAADVAFSVDGQILATAAGSNIWLWQTVGWNLLRTLASPGGVFIGIDFSPDGRELYSASNDEYIQIWGITP